MARAVVADLAPRNIRVNVVAPGWTKTPIWKRGPRANASAEESAKLVDFYSTAIPMGRWGEAEELAKAVLFWLPKIRPTSMRSSWWWMAAQPGLRSAACLSWLSYIKERPEPTWFHQVEKETL